MTPLLAWVWAPLLLLALSLGWGLLSDTVLRLRLPFGLLAPVGLAVMVVVSSLGMRTRLPELVTVALVAGAIAGVVVGRARLARGSREWSGAVTAALVYALYMAPIVFTGEATWAGYNFVNDTASNFVVTDVLEHHGVVTPEGLSGTTNNAANLLTSGYPLGAFSLLAGVRPLTGAPLEAVYQPAMAVFAALAGMSLTEIGRRAGLRAPAAVVAATVSLGGVLLYRYVLHGAIKEILLVALLATGVALAGLVVERRLALRTVVPVAIVGLACVLVFSVAAGTYLVALAGATAVVVAVSPERPSWAAVGRLLGVGAAVLLVVLLPMVGSTLDFVSVLDRLFSASSDVTEGKLGQLLRPLPGTEAAGIWLGRDYRLPAESLPGLNAVLVACSILAALAGVVVAVRRRAFGPLVLLVTVGAPALLLRPLVSGYIDGKLLVVLTPAVVFVGLFAAFTAIQSRRVPVRVVGAAALVAVGAGVLVSDLYGYRDARPAPVERMEAMEDVAHHVPDRGLYLFNEWEEFGKYFMRAARINPAAEVEAPLRLGLRADRGLPEDSPRRVQRFGRSFDLDEQTLPSLGRFAGIIQRRSPAASRPPASYRFLYANDDYELWRRDRRVRVRGHLPLQSGDRATAVPDCARVRRLAATARPGDRLVAATTPRAAFMSPLSVPRPAAWLPTDGPRGVRGSVVPTGPGRLRGTITAGGEQRVWIRASGGRAVTVSVDGRRVGSVREIDTPGQWLEVGRVRLPPGQRAHSIEVTRGGVTLRPGDAVRGLVGAVALQATTPDRLVGVAPRQAARLCGRTWDWIELVEPRS